MIFGINGSESTWMDLIMTGIDNINYNHHNKLKMIRKHKNVQNIYSKNYNYTITMETIDKDQQAYHTTNHLAIVHLFYFCLGYNTTTHQAPSFMNINSGSRAI